MRISVIIPALNEAHQLPALLDLLRWMPLHETIVVDGGSVDTTVRLATRPGVQVLSAPRGRARQMNAGAGLATGDVYWFLHADTRPPLDAIAQIRAALDGGAVGGAFRIWTTVDQGSHPLRLLFHLSDLRSRSTDLPYGDQGIFVRAGAFDAIGGFPDMEVLEDLAFSRALRRHGPRTTVPASIRVSSRRWEAHPIQYTILARTIPVAWRLGVPAHTLAGLWPTVRRSARLGPGTTALTRSGALAVYRHRTNSVERARAVAAHPPTVHHHIGAAIDVQFFDGTLVCTHKRPSASTPSLADVLAVLPEDTPVLLDLKSTIGSEPSIRALVHTTRTHRHPIVLASVDGQRIGAIASRCGTPACTLTWTLRSSPLSVRGGLEGFARKLGAFGGRIPTSGVIGCRWTALSTQPLLDARSAGTTVIAGGVDSPKAVDHVLASGVAGVFTDHPELFTERS